MNYKVSIGHNTTCLILNHFAEIKRVQFTLFSIKHIVLIINTTDGY